MAGVCCVRGASSLNVDLKWVSFDLSRDRSRPRTPNHLQNNNNGLTMRLRDSRPHYCLLDTTRLYRPSYYPIAEARPSSKAAFATVSLLATVAHNDSSLRTPAGGLSASTSSSHKHTHAACVYLFFPLFLPDYVTFTYFLSSRFQTRTNSSPRG